MKLSTLLDGVKVKAIKDGRGNHMDIDGSPIDIGGLSIDSRRVRAGDLFFALKGGRADGKAFIADAIGRGAAAVLADSPGGMDEVKAGAPAFIEVGEGEGRLALSAIAANFYGNPSRRLAVIGVTGTNGKTTTAFLIQQALECLGKKTGLIGTIKYIVGQVEKAAPFTTPEAPEFQSMLRAMLEAGQTHVVTEVSSHALAQRRVDGTSFRAAVFTNLTRDHLDFHKTMEDYFEAKKRLFTVLLEKEKGKNPSAPAIINMDDPFGRRLARELSGKAPVIGFGIEDENASDIRAASIVNGASGPRFEIVYLGRGYEVNSGLIGVHNVYNLMSAFGALVGLGFGAEEAAAAIQRLKGVKGRFERIDCGQDFIVAVDYAHTPDALERLIGAAREIAKDGMHDRITDRISDLKTGRKIIVVFGCGGDRDRGKRAQMGHIAASLADLAIVTSDNPRSEDPLAIIDDIKAGMDDINAAAGKARLFIPDRAEAIRKAVGTAAPGDIVLIAGKGHEDYQEIKGVRHPFSDQAAAVLAIKELAAGRQAIKERGC